MNLLLLMLTLIYLIYIILSDEIDKPFYTAYVFFFMLIFGLLIWIIIGFVQRCSESNKKHFTVDIGAPQTILITVAAPNQISNALENQISIDLPPSYSECMAPKIPDYPPPSYTFSES